MSIDVLSRLEPHLEPVRQAALAVDRDGAFPQEAIDALRAAGLMGLVTPEAHGGLGGGIPEAALVVERLARLCGSAAMVVCMHYCGAAVIAAHGDEATNAAIAAGEHLSTLAFSEAGSRSHFWAPVSTASRVEGGVALDAQKSWVTSARHASAYVWSSRPLEAQGASTIWLVPRAAAGLSVPGPFDGLGLRGNDSAPVSATGVVVSEAQRLGPDGGGFDVMMGVVLPMFNVLNAACSLGLMEAALAASASHVGATRYAHLGSALNELPTIRAYLAKARIQADMARGLWLDTLAALGAGRPDAMLRVLQVKAAAGEAALSVTDAAMRVCGGAAFRRELGVDRCFRDARAASVMAPTSDVLYDFIGKAVCGLPLF